MYNPPEHIQQNPLYNSGPTYTSWPSITSMQSQNPTLIGSSINCWSLTSSPPPPNQISAQPTPNHSPSPNYQHSQIASITNLGYPGYYTDVGYANGEFISVGSSEVTYAQIGPSERTTPIVYQNEVSSLEKGDYEGSSSMASPDNRPGSAPSTPRQEWIPLNHLPNWDEVLVLKNIFKSETVKVVNEDWLNCAFAS